MIGVLVDGLRPVTFSFSQLFKWDRCNFNWGISYRDGWVTDGKKKPLERGSIWNEILAIHYKALDEGEDPRPLVEAYVNEMLMGNLTGQLVQILDQLSWMYEHYYEWSQYVDSGQTTIAIEFHFALPFVSPAGRWFILQGYIDHVYEEAMQIWLRDHKTFSRTPISPIEAMMDPQMPVYDLALHRLGFKPFGIEFNEANTYEYKKREDVTPDKLFKRTRDYRTEQELEGVTHEIGLMVDDIVDHWGEPLRRSLRRDCRMCDMQDPCSMALKGIPIEDALQVGGFRKKTSFTEQQEETTTTDMNDWSI